jgi:hypothetical protein
MKKLYAALALMLAPLTAQAAVTYTLIDPVFNQAAIDAGATNFGDPSFGRVDITVSDAAVARGHFSLDLAGQAPFGAGGPQPNPCECAGGWLRFRGDTSDFISFHGRDLFSLTSMLGSITADLTFRADGSISAGTIVSGSTNDDLNFSGSSENFGGVFNSDQFGARCSPAVGGPECSVFGQLLATAVPDPTTVPEPLSLAILGAGVVGLGVVKSKRRCQNADREECAT